jgi:ATP-dependent Lon protease
LHAIVQIYTREAGVRSFERELMTLARKAVKEIMRSKKKSVKVTAGTFRIISACRSSVMARRREDQVGVVTGLAWTEVGGEFLTIEAS